MSAEREIGQAEERVEQCSPLRSYSTVAQQDPGPVHGLQIALLFDAAKLHLSRAVFLECNRLGILPIVVPAKLTWLHQPLGTDAFLRYKTSLRIEYQSARAALATVELGIADFLRCVYNTIRKVLQGRRWGGSFDANGFCVGQTSVSMTILRQLQ